MSGGAAVRGLSVADVQAMMATTLAADVRCALGLADVGAIGIGATKQVDVVIRPSMPSTGYAAAAVIIGTATLLGQLEVLSATVLSGSTVRVAVRNTSLLALNSGQVLVSAVRDT